jgi:multiple antibiotic resistance protein
MGFDVATFGAVFVTLLVIMDPPGMVPVFLALVGFRTKRQIARAALLAVLTSLLVIVAFAVFGEQVLRYLHISLPALQGAGGLLLLLVALELLTGKASDPEHVDDASVAMVPLGTPLLAGPGAIVATILAVRQADNSSENLAIAAAIIAVHVVVYLSLRYSGLISRILRPAGIMVITRVAGLLLAAIAVQLMADAVFGFLAESVM